MQRPDSPTRGGALWIGLLVVAALLAAVAMLLVGRSRAQARSGPEAVRVDPAPDDPIDFGAVADFRLTDQLGEAYGSADLAGDPWALAAIFTTCAGPCPRIVRGLGELQEELVDTDLRIVCLSVDPARDSPEVLRAYAEARGIAPERWRFLTGAEEEIHELLRSGFSMGVGREDDAPDGFHVTHATQVVAVDRAGRIRGWYSGTEEAGLEALAARLRHLDSEPEE